MLSNSPLEEVWCLVYIPPSRDGVGFFLEEGCYLILPLRRYGVWYKHPSRDGVWSFLEEGSCLVVSFSLQEGWCVVLPRKGMAFSPP